MSILQQFKHINWKQLLLFYGIILLGTFFARKLPNLLDLVLQQLTNIPINFNYNHGIVTLISALVFYKFSKTNQTITLLGNKKLKSFLFPLVLFIIYGFVGIKNQNGINNHTWALTTCSFALIYNIMEEYAWRGFLIDSLSKMSFIIKSIISGTLWAFWHLFIFNNFDQYGGFGIFIIFCIVFSLILTFAVNRTQSILVAACIHAFLIQTNIASLVCIILFLILLITWKFDFQFLKKIQAD